MACRSRRGPRLGARRPRRTRACPVVEADDGRRSARPRGHEGRSLACGEQQDVEEPEPGMGRRGGRGSASGRPQAGVLDVVADRVELGAAGPPTQNEVGAGPVVAVADEAGDLGTEQIGGPCASRQPGGADDQGVLGDPERRPQAAVSSGESGLGGSATKPYWRVIWSGWAPNTRSVSATASDGSRSARSPSRISLRSSGGRVESADRELVHVGGTMGSSRHQGSAGAGRCHTCSRRRRRSRGPSACASAALPPDAGAWRSRPNFQASESSTTAGRVGPTVEGIHTGRGARTPPRRPGGRATQSRSV